MQSSSISHSMIMINLDQCGTGTIWDWSEGSPRHLPGSAALSYTASHFRRHWPLSDTLWIQNLLWTNPTMTPPPLIITDALISASHLMHPPYPLTTRTCSSMSWPQQYLSWSHSPLSSCFRHASPSSPTLKYLQGQTTWITPPPSSPHECGCEAVFNVCPPPIRP